MLKKREGYKVRQANNNVADGIRETASALKCDRIKVCNHLKNWKEEVAGYRWDDSSGIDKPVKEKDHAMDAMRYFVKTKRVNKARGDYQPLWNRY